MESMMPNTLVKTAAGVQAEQMAEVNNTAMSPIHGLVIDDNLSQPDLQNPIINQVYVAPIIRRKVLDSGITAYYANIPPHIELYVRGVGLILEDGTLYKYCRYSESQGGFHKKQGVNYSLYVINSINEVGTNTIPTFNYSPIDDQSFIDDVMQQSQEQINTTITAIISSLEIYSLPTYSRIHTLTGLNVGGL